MTDDREGRCPICGHTRVLNEDGTIRDHHPYGSTTCEGSGQSPTRPILGQTITGSGPQFRNTNH